MFVKKAIAVDYTLHNRASSGAQLDPRRLLPSRRPVRHRRRRTSTCSCSTNRYTDNIFLLKIPGSTSGRAFTKRFSGIGWPDGLAVPKSLEAPEMQTDQESLDMGISLGSQRNSPRGHA